MGKRQIEHRGVVERVMSHGISVSIVQETACAACAAAALCHSSEKQQKMIDVPVVNAMNYRKGQEVTLVGEIGLGLRATLWAYAFPLVLLMVALMLGTRLTGSEGWGAMIGLFALVPYYIVLYMLRNKLQRTFSFRVKP